MLVALVTNEFKSNNHLNVVEVLRMELNNAAPEFKKDISELWDQLSPLIEIEGVISMEQIKFLSGDDCLINDHNFSGKFCFDSYSPELAIGVETMYDTNRQRPNAGIVCWNTKTNVCRIVVESLPKMREIKAIAVCVHDMKKTIICADGRFILGYDDKGFLEWRIDRGKFQYRDPSAVSIDISSCGTLVACGIKKSWRDEAIRPLEMLPVEVWTIPEGNQIPVRIHPQTKFVTGIKFLNSAASALIFGCNLGIQSCNILKGQFSVFGGEQGEAYLLEVSTCGKFVAAAYQNGRIKNVIVVFSLGNPEAPMFSMMADARVIDVKFAPGAKLLIVYLENGKLQIHSMYTLECCFEKTVAGDKVELSPNGNILYVIGFNTLFGFKILWDH